MITKSCELFTAKANTEDDRNNRTVNYRYILLECEKEIEYCGKKCLVSCFGVEIIREDVSHNSEYSTDSDRIENMTTYKYKIMQLIKKLYDNCVSPIHLIDIAGGYSDEWIDDFESQLSSTAVQ